ncbi:hypothetical protein HZH68_015724 [Vespula germanica]|uniref:Uncharacterized protein n=1 Tax=Vespula germanica TaxID=30212 RepID=A0A834J679_VESGE|nr:hypothetical protein HZH68_015724 [Vespula germanica]
MYALITDNPDNHSDVSLLLQQQPYATTLNDISSFFLSTRTRSLTFRVAIDIPMNLDLRPASLEKGQETLRLRVYACYAWGGPLLVAGLAALLDHLSPQTQYTYLRPRFGEKQCWFYVWLRTRPCNMQQHKRLIAKKAENRIVVALVNQDNSVPWETPSDYILNSLLCFSEQPNEAIPWCREAEQAKDFSSTMCCCSSTRGTYPPLIDVQDTRYANETPTELSNAKEECSEVPTLEKTL